MFVCVCIGLQAFYYPPDAGLPIGGPGSSRFLRLEVHYHNPLLISGTYSTHVNRHTWTRACTVTHLFFLLHTHTQAAELFSHIVFVVVFCYMCASSYLFRPSNRDRTNALHQVKILDTNLENSNTGVLSDHDSICLYVWCILCLQRTARREIIGNKGRERWSLAGTECEMLQIKPPGHKGTSFMWISEILPEQNKMYDHMQSTHSMLIIRQLSNLKFTL